MHTLSEDNFLKNEINKKDLDFWRTKIVEILENNRFNVNEYNAQINPIDIIYHLKIKGFTGTPFLQNILFPDYNNDLSNQNQNQKINFNPNFNNKPVDNYDKIRHIYYVNYDCILIDNINFIKNDDEFMNLIETINEKCFEQSNSYNYNNTNIYFDCFIDMYGIFKNYFADDIAKLFIQKYNLRCVIYINLSNDHILMDNNFVRHKYDYVHAYELKKKW